MNNNDLVEIPKFKHATSNDTYQSVSVYFTMADTATPFFHIICGNNTILELMTSLDKYPTSLGVPESYYIISQPSTFLKINIAKNGSTYRFKMFFNTTVPNFNILYSPNVTITDIMYQNS